MRIGYADPPYPGCADLYRDQPDYAGEVDHAALVAQLELEFDGWVLHTAATPRAFALLAPLVEPTGGRFGLDAGYVAFTLLPEPQSESDDEHFGGAARERCLLGKG